MNDLVVRQVADGLVVPSKTFAHEHAVRFRTVVVALLFRKLNYIRYARDLSRYSFTYLAHCEQRRVFSPLDRPGHRPEKCVVEARYDASKWMIVSQNLRPLHELKQQRIYRRELFQIN